MEIRQEAPENWGIDTGADTWQQENMDRNDIEEVEEVTSRIRKKLCRIGFQICPTTWQGNVHC